MKPLLLRCWSRHVLCVGIRLLPNGDKHWCPTVDACSLHVPARLSETPSKWRRHILSFRPWSTLRMARPPTHMWMPPPTCCSGSGRGTALGHGPQRYKPPYGRRPFRFTSLACWPASAVRQHGWWLMAVCTHPLFMATVGTQCFNPSLWTARHAERASGGGSWMPSNPKPPRADLATCFCAPKTNSPFIWPVDTGRVSPSTWTCPC